MAKTHVWDGWRRLSLKLPKAAFEHLDELVGKAEETYCYIDGEKHYAKGNKRLKGFIIRQALKALNEASPAGLEPNFTPVIPRRAMNGERHLHLVPSTQKKQDGLSAWRKD